MRLSVKLEGINQHLKIWPLAQVDDKLALLKIDSIRSISSDLERFVHLAGDISGTGSSFFSRHWLIIPHIRDSNESYALSSGQ